MDKLIERTKQLMEIGVYDPNELFDLIYPTSRKHYATVRRAIHIAKAGIFR